jgi:hypothetical protein
LSYINQADQARKQLLIAAVAFRIAASGILKDRGLEHNDVRTFAARALLSAVGRRLIKSQEVEETYSKATDLITGPRITDAVQSKLAAIPGINDEMDAWDIAISANNFQDHLMRVLRLSEAGFDPFMTADIA